MSWRPAPPRPPAPWFQRLLQATFAPGALREDASGVGVSLTEAIVMLSHAIDRAATAIEQFNEER